MESKIVLIGFKSSRRNITTDFNSLFFYLGMHKQEAFENYKSREK